MPEPGRVLRILHVEDDPDFAVLVRMQLEDQPYLRIERVDHVGSVAEAVTSVIDGPGYDVAIVDMGLPDGDGFDLLDSLSVHAPETAAIVLTANDDLLDGVTALNRGASDFLSKAELSGETITRAVRFALERKQFELRLRDAAHHDELTGLANRRGMLHCHETLAAAARRSGMLLAAVVLDLDGFKAVNDTLGHHAGDDVLRAVAGALTVAARDADCVARTGGDEFAIVTVVHEPDEVLPLVERVRSTIERAEIDGGVALVTAATGHAVGAHHVSLEHLLRDADQRMYDDKRRRTPGRR